MMKYSLLLLLLTTFIACDKGHNYADKKTFVVTDKMKEEIYQKALAANKIKTCEPEKEEKEGFFKRAKNSIVGLFTKKDKEFDITYPQVLTERVLKEIEAYIRTNQKFAPEEFWIALSSETQTYIDKYLIEEFVGLTDEQFLELRDFVAFSFLFYFQEDDRKSGYEIQLDEEDLPISKIRIAYETSAIFEERKKINFCEQEGLLDITFVEDQAFLKPSNVTARVMCEKDSNKIRLDLVNDTDLTFSVANSKISKILKLHMDDFEKNFSNHGLEKASTLKYSQDGTEIELKVRVKKKDDQKFLFKKIYSLTAHLNDGTEFSMKKLKCKSVKSLRLE